MHTTSHEKLAAHLKPGRVYRRDMLLSYSKAIDRDLMTLVKKGALEKLSTGLYYKPSISRFGALPSQDKDLVKCFLRDDSFLLYSWNLYNSLGLGLTQIYNRLVVYNRKRHGIFNLGGKEFDFRRPLRGFPHKLTSEFLVIDLLNNLGELAEDTESVKNQIKHSINKYDRKKLALYAKQYGKIATKHFIEETSH